MVRMNAPYPSPTNYIVQTMIKHSNDGTIQFGHFIESVIQIVRSCVLSCKSLFHVMIAYMVQKKRGWDHFQNPIGAAISSLESFNVKYDIDRPTLHRRSSLRMSRHIVFITIGYCWIRQLLLGVCMSDPHRWLHLRPK
jgi:hypothetical protein